MTENCPTSVREQILCSHCKGYLSSAPIFVLPDGNFICSRCAHLYTYDVQAYRAHALEAVFINLWFPCRFKQYGCTENVFFDKGFQHEPKCSYRTFACPTLPQLDCKWEGPTSQMHNHFTNHHPDFVMQNAELELQVNQNLQGVLLTKKNYVVFIMKFEYDASKKHLHYDIRYCRTKTVTDVSFTIQLMSISDNSCSAKLKTNKCPMLITNFPEKQSADVVNLSSFLEMAEYPENIKIVFDITLENSSTNSSDDLAVNYSLLDTIRCHDCNKYLIPPLFDIDGRTICSVCAEHNDTCTPSSNTKIKNLVAVTNYPCRWRECSFVGKSGDIKMHEESICKFRYHDCFYQNCQGSFKLADAVTHLKTHGGTYLPDKMIYKTSFHVRFAGCKHVFTIKDGSIFSILHSPVMLNDNSSHTHEVLFQTSSCKTNSVSLYFEHNHCKLRSKTFTLTKGDAQRNIGIKDLPQCFKSHEELTIYVEINEPQG